MKLKSLEIETKELIANALGIYYALQNKNRAYCKEGMEALSLYAGVLRLGITPTISVAEPIRTSPGAGYPYPNCIRPNMRNELIEYRHDDYDYKNVVCQILNEHGITIEQVIDALNLDSKLTIPTKYKASEKIEKQYNVAYKTLLQTIRKYYIASVQQTSENKKYCKPIIDLNIPTIISAIHYNNVDASNSINRLYTKLCGTKASYLAEIEKLVTYKEELGKLDKNGNLKLYRVRKTLKMNQDIGRII